MNKKLPGQAETPDGGASVSSNAAGDGELDAPEAAGKPAATRPAATKRAARMRPADRMRGIEQAAREVFASQGYESASISEIARRSGVAEGLIYKYYDGKRHLLNTILRAWLVDAVATSRAKLQALQGTRARLHMIIWQLLKTIKDNPDLNRLFYAEVRTRHDYRESEFYELNKQASAQLVDVVQDGMARGELRDDISVHLVRHVVYGGIEHQASAFLAGRGQFDHDRLAHDLCALVMDGLMKPRPPSELQDTVVDLLERVL